MGFSLHIQRVDGHEADLPIATITDALEMLEVIPWSDEISQWELVPEEDREARRPLFQIFDDSGHALHMTPYSELFIALGYTYPVQHSMFGSGFTDEEGFIGTEQYPRGELRTLLKCFSTSDTEAMLLLLSKFPTVERDKNT